MKEILPSSEQASGKNNTSAQEDNFSFGVKKNEKGETELFIGDGKDQKEGPEKDGSDKDNGKQKNSFREAMQKSMKDEIDASKANGDKKILFIRIAIKISDIEKAAEKGDRSSKMTAEKLTRYEDGEEKTEEVEVEMSQEQAQGIMSGIPAAHDDRDQGLFGMIKGLFGMGEKDKEGKGGKEEDKEKKDKDEITEIADKLKDKLSPAEKGATGASDMKNVNRLLSERNQENNKERDNGGR